MYFKIRKANDRLMCLSPSPTDCNKWHIVFDENEAIGAVRCFALRRLPKCKNCRLATTIRSRSRRKINRKMVRKLKRSR